MRMYRMSKLALIRIAIAMAVCFGVALCVSFGLMGFDKTVVWKAEPKTAFSGVDAGNWRRVETASGGDARSVALKDSAESYSDAHAWSVADGGRVVKSTYGGQHESWYFNGRFWLKDYSDCIVVERLTVTGRKPLTGFYIGVALTNGNVLLTGSREPEQWHLRARNSCPYSIDERIYMQLAFYDAAGYRHGFTSFAFEPMQAGEKTRLDNAVPRTGAVSARVYAMTSSRAEFDKWGVF